ncbi:hypothetical protein D6783_00730 [Candidatus Woesearchaeota archaeon]|nr:MAG: hypothetical protein D6783_00730 [Candidatus Woesearchaeota archaeon]
MKTPELTRREALHRIVTLTAAAAMTPSLLLSQERWLDFDPERVASSLKQPGSLTQAIMTEAGNAYSYRSPPGTTPKSAARFKEPRFGTTKTLAITHGQSTYQFTATLDDQLLIYDPPGSARYEKEYWKQLPLNEEEQEKRAQHFAAWETRYQHLSNLLRNPPFAWRASTNDITATYFSLIGTDPFAAATSLEATRHHYLLINKDQDRASNGRDGNAVRVFYDKERDSFSIAITIAPPASLQDVLSPHTEAYRAQGDGSQNNHAYKLKEWKDYDVETTYTSQTIGIREAWIEKEKTVQDYISALPTTWAPLIQEKH